ncbi:unnamed protein product [Bemisia tabaci]|uniref:DUF8207 domain-containing protein n=1 Tax=Bemisia tabaci TaxID=7038 RepID=A0A9P0F2Z0_BEMTA|nr:unnamed protein product [Bemisia tabaci]
MEKKLKEEIVKAADSIRSKYRKLKRGLIEEESAAKKRFEPLVKPLEAIIDLTKEKDEIDEEEEVEEGEVQAENEVRRIKKEKAKSGARKSILKSKTPASAHNIEVPGPSREDVFEDVGEKSSAKDARDALEVYLNTFGPLGEEYLRKLLFWPRSKLDHTFGVRVDVNNSKYHIGNKEIEFDEEDWVHVDGETYHGSRGLFELLFMRNPDENEITNSDKRKYKQILEISSAHKQGFHPEGRIRSSAGVKYLNIIQKLFPPVGRGLLPVTDNKIDYVHWDDPNELVDRLALLIASEKAGNGGHIAEIASIEEELREANFIK